LVPRHIRDAGVEAKVNSLFPLNEHSEAFSQMLFKRISPAALEVHGIS
jgi:hypothetical protein